MAEREYNAKWPKESHTIKNSPFTGGVKNILFFIIPLITRVATKKDLVLSNNIVNTDMNTRRKFSVSPIHII